MLNELADFYRIVNPEPSDDVVVQRREAILAFVPKLADPLIRFACAELAVCGQFGKPTAAQAEISKLLVDAIREQQPAFSTDIAKNPMDLRICAGIAVAEFLKGDEPDSDVAALIVAGATARGVPGDRHLASFVTALVQNARDYLNKRSETNRERPGIPTFDVKGSDHNAVAQATNSALKALARVVTRGQRVDGEELDILWWAFGERSSLLDQPFASIEMAPRVVTAAIELANMSLLPPLAGSQQFIRKVVGADTEMSLASFIQGCGREVLETVAVRSDKNKEVVKRHAPMLPLTWLSGRRLESDLAPGWEAEYEVKSGLASDAVRSVYAWAEQVFAEKIATRFTYSTLKDQ